MTAKNSKIIRLFSYIGDIILGTGKHAPPVECWKKGLAKNRRTVPKILRGFFEKRHAGWPEYVILKTQIVILALFLTNVFYTVLLPSESLLFLAMLSICSLYLIYQTKTQLKPAFKQDYPAYQSFVAICIAINWALPLLLKLLPAIFPRESNLSAILPTFLAIGLVVIAFAAFRLKYGRNFTYGSVEKSRGRVVLVRVGYDIRSNVGPGIYSVKSLLKVKRGDVVKLSVARPLLGLGGTKVGEIVEVVDRITSA